MKKMLMCEGVIYMYLIHSNESIVNLITLFIPIGK